MIKACLNGGRLADEHPAVPLTPEQAAAAARAGVAAGAEAVHVHPRDEAGLESLEASVIHATVRAIRESCPGVPVGVSTRDGIAADPATKLQLVAGWPGPDEGGPDMASVNWHETGSLDIAEALSEKGIGVEAGIWTPETADTFAASGWPDRVIRVLVEIIPGWSPRPDAGGAREIVDRLTAMLATTRPLLVHGEDECAWGVLRWAQSAGYDLRVGLEDTLVDEDGQQVADSAALVRAALSGS